MTSAHFMLARVHQPRGLLRRSRLAAMMMTFSALTLMLGCASEPLVLPAQLGAPYERTQLWAVAPFVNESGVSIVNGERIADLFAEQAEQVHGVSAVPVNRVLVAMRRLELRAVNTHADAATLMNALGVDGLIVGTVTAYDPYTPPKLGVAIQLYRRERPPTPMQFDLYRLQRARTELVPPDASGPMGPVNQVSGVFDGANHQTLLWLDQYSAGRTEPRSAYGKRVYLVSMELYTQFVAFRMMHDLLQKEWTRTYAAASDNAPPR